MLIYLIFPKIEMHVKQNENKYRPKNPPTKQMFKDSTSKSLRYILKIPIICFLLQALCTNWTTVLFLQEERQPKLFVLILSNSSLILFRIIESLLSDFTFHVQN